MNLQDLILSLQSFWAERGTLIQQPYDLEVGAGTFHPDTFFRVLGPEPWRVAFVQPSRRPGDGRYGENPMRVYKHLQMQVILKPGPEEVQDLYLESLRAFGVDPKEKVVGVLMIQQYPTTSVPIADVFQAMAYQAIVR